MYKDGDTFWYHDCPHTDKKVYLPIGMKRPNFTLEAITYMERAKIQQQIYLNEIEGKD